MKRILILTLAMTALSTAAQAVDHRKDTETDEFMLLSGNIKCVHGATDDCTGIYCLRAEPKLFSVRFLDGVVSVDVAEGDQPFMNTPPVMAYGETREYKDMTCGASRQGITCKSGRKGFRLSKSEFKMFK